MTFTCTGAGGTTPKTISWDAYLSVAVTLRADKTTVIANAETANITWTGTNADSCRYNDTNYNSSHSVEVGPFSEGTHTIAVSCRNPLGSKSKSITIRAVRAPPPAPVVSATVSPEAVLANQGTISVTYSATHANYCSYEDVRYPTSGIAILGPFTVGSHSVTFTCTGAGGTTPKTVRWAAYLPVSITLTADKTTVIANKETANITWTGANADSCRYNDTDYNSSHSVEVGPFSEGMHTIRVSCRNPLGSESQSITITANPAPTSPVDTPDDTPVEPAEEQPIGTPPPPKGFDGNYDVFTSSVDSTGRAVMYFESTHPSTVVPGVSNFALEFLNGEVSRIIARPEQADINLATRKVSQSDIQLVDFNFDGPKDFIIENLGSYIPGALDTVIFGNSTPNSAPDVFREFDDVLINFMSGISNYLNNPSPTDAELDAGGVEMTYTLETQVTNRGIACLYGEATPQEIQKIIELSRLFQVYDFDFEYWSTVLVPLETTACELLGGRVIRADYVVTTTETDFVPLEEVYSANELAILRALRAAIGTGGLESDSKEARDAERAIGNVFGIPVGDINGGDLDDSITDPDRYAAVFESEIYGDLIISEEAQRIVNNIRDFESRHELFEDYDENLRTDEDAIDTRFFAAAAIVLSEGGLGFVDTRFGIVTNLAGSFFESALTKESSDFLRESSNILSYATVEIYLRLIEGEELPFAMGLTGEALDNAIVEYEQQTVENIINSDLVFGTASLPATIRPEVLRDISASLNSDNLASRYFSDDCVEEALNQTFPNNDIDFADKADRIALGKQMVFNQRNPAQSSCM